MSMAEIFRIMSIGGYLLAAIFGVLAVVFWFRFNIPQVYNDLSGRAAQKRIQRLRAANEEGEKERAVFRPARAASEGMQSPNNGTQTLADGTQTLADGTQMLSNGTQMLADGTMVLPENKEAEFEGTALLLHSDSAEGEAEEMEMVMELMLLHTDEIIE